MSAKIMTRLLPTLLHILLLNISLGLCEPANDDPSWMTRIASWLFPADPDSAPAEARNRAQYLPPENAECNSCNDVPWVPMSNNLQHASQNVILNFVPPPKPSISSSSSHFFSSPPRARPSRMNFPFAANNHHLPAPNEYMVPPPLPAPYGMLPPPPVPPSIPYHPVLPYKRPAYFRNDQLPLQDTSHLAAHLPAPHKPKSSFTVEIIPSLKVADYVSTIEHPINVIQSSILDVDVKPQLSTPPPTTVLPTQFQDYPIVVDDTHAAAASSVNNVSLVRNQPQTLHPTTFQPPGTNYLKKLLLSQIKHNSPYTTASTNTLRPSTTTQPPPDLSTSKREIQIIVPYIMKPFTRSQFHHHTTLPITEPSHIPFFTTPSTTSRTTTKVSNIHDLLRELTTRRYYHRPLPFDVISLQHHIDDWTQTAYQKSDNQPPFVRSRKIPDEYFSRLVTTTPRPYQSPSPGLEPVPTTIVSDAIVLATSTGDYESAGSNDIETNLILETDFVAHSNSASTTTTTTTTTASSTTPTTTTPTTTTSTTTTTTTPTPMTTTMNFQADSPSFDDDEDDNSQNNSWDVTQVTVSPLTNEKVYIVTPQPVKQWSLAPKVHTNATKFMIRVEATPKDTHHDRVQDGRNNGLTVVFSEWPHLINNLQTTTTEHHRSSTSTHPLFGLMGLTSYRPPPNATVETFVGHSKVMTSAAPSHA